MPSNPESTPAILVFEFSEDRLQQDRAGILIVKRCKLPPRDAGETDVDGLCKRWVYDDGRPDYVEVGPCAWQDSDPHKPSQRFRTGGEAGRELSLQSTTETRRLRARVEEIAGELEGRKTVMESAIGRLNNMIGHLEELQLLYPAPTTGAYITENTRAHAMLARDELRHDLGQIGSDELKRMQTQAKNAPHRAGKPPGLTRAELPEPGQTFVELRMEVHQGGVREAKGATVRITRKTLQERDVREMRELAELAFKRAAEEAFGPLSEPAGPYEQTMAPAMEKLREPLRSSELGHGRQRACDRSGCCATPSGGTCADPDHAMAQLDAVGFARRFREVGGTIANLARAYLDLLANQQSDDHKDAMRDAEHALSFPTSPRGADAVFLNLARCYLSLRRRAKAEPNWKLAALRLWGVLDDIDTLDDAAREDDAAFRKRCYALQQLRHDILPGRHIDVAAQDATLPTQLRRRFLPEACDGEAPRECNCEARARGEAGGHRMSCPKYDNGMTWLSEPARMLDHQRVGNRGTIFGLYAGTPTFEKLRALVDAARRENMPAISEGYGAGCIGVYLTWDQARALIMSNEVQRLIERSVIEQNRAQPGDLLGIIAGAALFLVDQSVPASGQG